MRVSLRRMRWEGVRGLRTRGRCLWHVLKSRGPVLSSSSVRAFGGLLGPLPVHGGSLPVRVGVRSPIAGISGGLGPS